MRFFLTPLKTIIKTALCVLFLILLLTNPNIAKESAKGGLLLAGNVIIPTLFPFLVCALIIYKNRILDILPFSKKIRHLKDNFAIFLLSNLGGYPIGAKLINEKFGRNELSKKDAELLLFCSVNSGPAFSILVVGGGILHSFKLGIVIYLSQLISSLIMFIAVSSKFSREISALEYKKESFVDMFVTSVSDASSAMLNISGYIVICSTFLGIINNSKIYGVFKTVINLTLEISNAIISTKNVYILVIILSFSSFSIIFQVLSICRAFSPSILKIMLSRVIHAFLSGGFTYLLLKIFPIARKTVSNTANAITFGNNSIILTSLLILTLVTLFYSLNSKKYCGKISADIF